MTTPMTRDEAFAVLQKYVTSESHLRHAQAVEACMRQFAKEQGEDVEYWGMVGLLHDIDFDLYPDRHCEVAPEILKKEGFDDDFIHAVVSHGYGLREASVKPELFMEKVLFTVDELSGFITAYALMRPSKSVQDMEVKSAKKKFKDLRFAAKIDREVIQRGADMMGWDLGDVMGQVIEGLKPICHELGLETVE